MKKKTIIPVLFLLIFIQFTSAGGVGISPVSYKEFFEPGLERSYTFYSFSTNPEKVINLYVKGDLAQYVTLSKTYLHGGGDFVVTIKLPGYIEKPGTHEIIVGAIESIEDSNKSNIGGIAAIQGRIDILVPYPGKYTESTFKISNINQGEEAPYEIEVQNLGTKSLVVNSKIEIFKANITDPLVTKILPETTVESKETFRASGTLDTRNISPGDYKVIATIDWEKNKTIYEETLRIGEFLVEITDYDYQFYEGKISPFNVEIQNKWNAKISEVYATITITDAGRFITDFKTVSVSTSPWEIKNITGYFDTTGLEAKRYTALIDLSYGGAKSSKLVAIYVNEPPAKTYKNYIIATIIIALLLLLLFVYLILKIRKLNIKKNEKKK